MNSKAIEFIKNMSYSISSNLVSLIISTIVILIIPKIIGVEEYGYWQLYLFYTSYIGFLHFGWNDGIYLRYGGKEYKKLDKELFFSQFIEIFVFQILIALIMWIFTSLWVDELNRNFILKMTAVATILVNVRLMLLYILQATNRIKEYARITMLDRLLYIILILALIVSGMRDYKLMIVADLISKLVTLIYSMILCKEIVFHSLSSWVFSFNETKRNIGVGLSLTFANIASMLIIGAVKFGIENVWDVSTFGKVSLTLSISNMMMIFINAVGVIIFPVLRRTNPNKLSRIYVTVKDLLMTILFGMLVVYFPLKSIMATWLPQYEESLLYMALVFPMFIYEGKMALLISTYLKTLRLEKMMLRINIICMVLSILFTYFSAAIVGSLEISMLNIVILLALRSVLAELYLSQKLNIAIKKDIIIELVLTVVFIFSGWFINSIYTIIIYSLGYAFYLIIKRKDIQAAFKDTKSLLYN